VVKTIVLYLQEMDICILGDQIAMDNVELVDNNKVMMILHLFQKIQMNYKRYTLLKEYFLKCFHMQNYKIFNVDRVLQDF
jgi:hypothetical protein